MTHNTIIGLKYYIYYVYQTYSLKMNIFYKFITFLKNDSSPIYV